MIELQNGYYLSIYADIDKYHNLMMFSERHDHNISLWKKENDDVNLIHHWELERLTGIKHHSVSFKDKEDLYDFINQLLSQYNMTLSDIIEIFGTSEISTIANYHSINDYPQYTYHAITHLFSSMIMDSNIFYNEIIIALAFDYGSDRGLDEDLTNKYMHVGAISKKGKIELFPIFSPGLYWATAKLLFNMEEGTLMALANASNSVSYEPLVDKFLNDNKILISNNDYIIIYKTLTELKDIVFSYKEEDMGKKFNYYDVRFTQEENKISMVMKIIQKFSLMQLDYIIDQVVLKYQINPINCYISLSGGFALNCPTNTHLMNKYNFKGQFIIPCTNDGGHAIGMGLYYFYKSMVKFNFRFPSYAMGDKDDNIEYLQRDECNLYIESIEEGLKKFVDDIIISPIIWFDGRAEIGPRSLGQRSVLADARNIESRRLLNVYKQRQWWRPVAPIILEEYLEEYFSDSFPSPYMLNNFKINDGKKHLVPAIVHFDDTSRVQSINEKSYPRLYKLLEEFRIKTNIPVICNTSLNDKGEPIIDTISQTLNFALRKGIKVMYINGFRVALKCHEKYPVNEPEKRPYKHFFESDKVMLKEMNPYNLNRCEYGFYIYNKKSINADLKNRHDVEMIKKMFIKLEKVDPQAFFAIGKSFASIGAGSSEPIPL